jgi:hypothetical protein
VIEAARPAEDNSTMNTRYRRLVLLTGAVVVAFAIAVPVMGADPSPSAGPPGQSNRDKAPKAAKGPEVSMTVEGTVTQTSDEKGRPKFTLTANGKSWELSAGPSWYWGDNNPLKAYVGQSVTVVGTTHAGDTELDVESINGKALREGGKPPWAGGPWVVGKTHPGWKAWMADGKPGKGAGRDGAPGQLKKKTGAGS